MALNLRHPTISLKTINDGESLMNEEGKADVTKTAKSRQRDLLGSPHPTHCNNTPKTDKIMQVSHNVLFNVV